MAIDCRLSILNRDVLAGIMADVHKTLRRPLQSYPLKKNSKNEDILFSKKPNPFAFETELTLEYPVSLVEQITKFLTDAIMEGKIENGQRLGESELQRRFGISRSPIRESFRILEKNGLVITVPRKGTFVRKITRKDIEENFPIRALLEGFAARLAISHSEPEDIRRMEFALSKMVEAVKENDFGSYFKYHSDFHDAFIYASKNDTLIEILDNLRRRAIWFRFTYLWHQANYDYSIRVHSEILDLVIKKDADRLEALVKEHTLIALDDFQKFLNSKS